MISIKLGQIVNAERTFDRINTLAQEEKLPFKLTYKIARIIKKLQPELKDYYTQREKIISKFGVQVMTKTVDEKTGEAMEIPSGEWTITDQEKFKKYMEQLLNLDVELSNVYPFTEEELADLSGLTPENLLFLEPFMAAPKEEEPTERKQINIDIEDVEKEAE